MESTANLFWSIMFGAFALGFLSYGKKQKLIVPLIAGLGLLAFPYFISNLYLPVTIGCSLIALPFFVRFY